MYFIIAATCPWSTDARVDQKDRRHRAARKWELLSDCRHLLSLKPTVETGSRQRSAHRTE
jgi:hypothetical protein